MSTEAPCRTRMQAMAIAMVKNEADIIEAFVRHNLHFVDLLVVIDNLSSDGTGDILRALRREGLPLLVIDDPVFGHFQSEKVTEVYRRFAPVFQPELVYLLDADEFIRAPHRGALEAALAPLPPGSAALLPWSTYLPAPQRPAADLRNDPLGCMTLRRRHEEPCYHKAVIRRRPADDSGLVIEQGNHAVHLAGGRPVAHHRLPAATIAHLPVRSVDQLTAKVINGWHACLVRNRHRDVPGEAYQWKALYEQITQGRGLSADALVDVALSYAQSPRDGRSLGADSIDDPMPSRYGSLRHLALGRHDALAKVVLGMQACLRGDPTEPTVGPAMDLAPVLDLLRLLDTRRLAATPPGRPWVEALASLLPLTPSEAGAAPEVLLAPLLSHAESLRLASQTTVIGARHVICWPDAARSPDALRDELLAWAAKGWEPKMLPTMGMRAQASYAALRHGAFVFGPANGTEPARADAVRQALCQMASAPHAWTDPPAQCVRHPLQSLALGRRSATPTAASPALVAA